ncbi:MAG: geranylgeranyl diphosphate reductase, partial [Gammaproteobacteria bacterium]
AIPAELLVAHIRSARMVSPAAERVDMPIADGFVGMVDRDEFDAWLRQRARAAGAEVRRASFERLDYCPDGSPRVYYRRAGAAPDAPHEVVQAAAVIGADGARSAVARQCMPGEEVPCVSAYHEIVETPDANFDGSRCDVWYQGRLSPDFYGWVIPHGAKVSVGVGTARRGFSLRGAVRELRANVGLDGVTTLRCEGAPIPMRPRRRWDDGRAVVLAGDAAGVVAPASGEGIYYAMTGGRLAAEAVTEFVVSGDHAALKLARKRFMRAHGRVFWVLGMLQRFWYADDRRRERFVSMCRDPDVQHLTWEAYMHKRLVRAKPAAHMRIFFKDLAHLLGVVRP